MVTRRSLLVHSLLFLTGCAITRPTQPQTLGKLTIGVVAYGEGTRSITQYDPFIKYLEGQTKQLVELEPVFNEVKALEELQRQSWSLVFANSGLAAIALSRFQYVPLFSLQGVDNLRSVLVVRNDSPVQTIADLNGKRAALGQPGSATSYYVPLYDLYGLTLSEVQIAPTPKAILAAIAQSEVTVGALSKDEFDRYRSEFNGVEFRILQTSRRLPPGAVLISPTLERQMVELIQKSMNEALPTLAQGAGYIPNAPVPDYRTLIGFIDKVKPIEPRIYEKPAPLYQGKTEASQQT